MRARLTERLADPSVAYIPTTDEESGQDEPPKDARRVMVSAEILELWILLLFIESHGRMK